MYECVCGRDTRKKVTRREEKKKKGEGGGRAASLELAVRRLGEGLLDLYSLRKPPTEFWA